MGPLEGEPQDAVSRQGGEFSRLLEDLARPATAPAADEAWQDASVAPTELGRFKILRALGRGGFGVVYEAEDPELGRHVAIKVLQQRRGGGQWNEMLKREAEAVAKLAHPAIVTIHEAGREGGQIFLVYELLQGEPLRRVMARGRVPRVEAVRILRGVASALAYAHRVGVVHRDLTPGNVFLVEGGAVKVVDFGLSLMVGAIGLAAGTPPYAAPEQWRGEAVTPRADVYAWGAVAYELLTAHPLDDDATLPGWLARRGPLASLVRAACSEDRDRRPADGAALVDALDGIERGRRHWAVGAALSLVVAMAAVIAFLLVSPPPKPPPQAAGPFRLAIADGDNDTGDPSFDGLGTLLAAVLDGTERLEILGRSRLAGVLRASGRAVGERIDAESADLAAQQAGAAAVLVPRATREASGYLLTAMVRRPAAPSPWFVVTEAAADPAGLMNAAGRLGQGIRTALHAREPEVRSPEAERARTVTSSTEAFRLYYDGILCLERPSRGAGSWVAPDCGRHFRAALAIDPEFPLAHLELVRDAYWSHESSDQLLAKLEPALRRADLVPARDRAQLLAWKAFLEDDVEGAVARMAEAGRQFPEDARVALATGDLLFRAGRLRAATEPLRRATELDPSLDLALDGLVWMLGVLDRTGDLGTLVERLDHSTPTPGVLHAQVQGLGWLGEHDKALAVARRAAAGGDPPALEDLAEALVAAGRLDEAEAVVRQLDPAGQGERRLLGNLLLLEGRFREAEAYVDAPSSADSDPGARYVHDWRLALRLSQVRDAAGVRRLADETRVRSNEEAATFAALLAYAGDGQAALALLPFVKTNPANRDVVSAIAAWRRDGARAALPDLQRVVTGDPQIGNELLPPEAPWWLVAECASEAGDGEAALAAAGRFQRFYFPLGFWRPWAYPRSLVLEARLLAGSGRKAEARAALDRLDGLWRRADPGQPLLAEARALRRAIDGSRKGIPDDRGR